MRNPRNYHIPAFRLIGTLLVAAAFLGCDLAFDSSAAEPGLSLRLSTRETELPPDQIAVWAAPAEWVEEAAEEEWDDESRVSAASLRLSEREAEEEVEEIENGEDIEDSFFEAEDVFDDDEMSRAVDEDRAAFVERELTGDESTDGQGVVELDLVEGDYHVLTAVIVADDQAVEVHVGATYADADQLANGKPPHPDELLPPIALARGEQTVADLELGLLEREELEDPIELADEIEVESAVGLHLQMLEVEEEPDVYAFPFAYFAVRAEEDEGALGDQLEYEEIRIEGEPVDEMPPDPRLDVHVDEYWDALAVPGEAVSQEDPPFHLEVTARFGSSSDPEHELLIELSGTVHPASEEPVPPMPVQERNVSLSDPGGDALRLEWIVEDMAPAYRVRVGFDEGRPYEEVLPAPEEAEVMETDVDMPDAATEAEWIRIESFSAPLAESPEIGPFDLPEDEILHRSYLEMDAPDVVD